MNSKDKNTYLKLQVKQIKKLRALTTILLDYERARVSLSLLSLRKNGGLLVVYNFTSILHQYHG